MVDTGRHAWHSDAILAFARDRKQPIAAIVNTHWHLDHSSGNGRLEAAYPDARVYTTSAVNQAIAPGGFIARNLAAARERPPDANPMRREETEIFIATMATPDTLRPDVVIERSETRPLAGRPLALHVTADAVTAADLWLYDEVTQVAVVGDLVTLPAPFFETACPAQWQHALDEVWSTPFRAGDSRSRRADEPRAVRRLSPGVHRLPGLCRRRQRRRRSVRPAGPATSASS